MKAVRWIVFGLTGLVFGPVVLFGVFVMVTAGVGLVFNANLNPFDFSDIGVLDWLFGGPAASGGDAHFFLQSLVGAIIAGVSFSSIGVAWVWARGGL